MMKLAFAFWALLGLFPALRHAAFNIQKPGLTQSQQSKERAEEVKATFLAAFNDYTKYGFPYDEVRPVTKRGQNTRNGWSATLVDALDTLFIMGFKDEFEKGVANTLKIDFSKSQQIFQSVSVFESTIRYVGGMLSAYELTGATNSALLAQAQKLADKLLVAWPDSQQPLPYSRLEYTMDRPTSKDYITAASAGSMILEFDRLSFYTKEPKYLNFAKKSMKVVMNTPSTFPGLPGFIFGVRNQTILDDFVTWSGGTDSYLEYLLKYGMMINNADLSYYSTWKLAVQSSIQNLIKVSPVHNLTYLAEYSQSNGGIDYQFSHLACFASGNWLMGGKVLNDTLVSDYGLRLLHTCMQTYNSTQTGLGPEIFRFLGPQGETSGPQKPSDSDLDFFKKNGFYISEAEYKLRPETLESAFIAWRLTGDEQYLDFTWKAFKAIQKHCKAPASFSAIEDVNKVPAKLSDNSESFFYAETLKYIYLTFAPPTVLSLDEYVYNTEAHPFRYIPISEHSAVVGPNTKVSSTPRLHPQRLSAVILFALCVLLNSA